MLATERKYFKLNGCPRCHGDLLIDKAYYDYPVEVCIQCGFHHYLEVGGKGLIIKINESASSIN
ncbi:hypothetical protein ACFLUF_00980 [Chloroflexota bacterium]